ncbi:MAG: DUF4336 domain-containing protein [Hyphomonadaceae bacterium]
MSALEQFGEDIWIAAGPTVQSFGFRYPTRMAAIRLADGGLFIWSPVGLSAELHAAIDALGEVRSIVTPTALHSAFLDEWKRAYPTATLFAAPASHQRSKDIAFDADLSDTPPETWAGQIDQVLMRGNAIATEAVFFHRKSATVLFADLLQNFPPGWFKGLQSLIAQLDGMVGSEPRTPQKFKVAFTDRKTAREALHRILDWPAESVLMAHGDPVRQDGRTFIARAFNWL